MKPEKWRIVAYGSLGWLTLIACYFHPAMSAQRDLPSPVPSSSSDDTPDDDQGPDDMPDPGGPPPPFSG